MSCCTCSNFLTTTNESRELGWKILGNTSIGCTQRGKRVAQVGMAQLHDPCRALDAAQRMGPQMSQPSAGRKAVEHEFLGRPRQ